ncbi:MAG TPA: hypothetical protein VK973_17760 [Arenicellales bacterium]|nr:hypothetical protein [Arenicellales bacterium]
MIDALQRIAVRFRPLRQVAVILGLGCLVALAVVLLSPPAAGGGDRYLVPALIGFIWSLSAYGFIDTFQSVPARLDMPRGMLARMRRAAARGWYWFLAILFAASTLAALLLTFKLGAYWLGAK